MKATRQAHAAGQEQHQRSGAWTQGLRHLTTLIRRTLALTCALGMLAAIAPLAHAKQADHTAPQIIDLGTQSYRFAVYANNDLAQSLPVVRAVIVVHGVKRNAGDYFQLGQHLLKTAQLPVTNTLLIAPNFMTNSDQGSSTSMPLWGGGTWMQGEASEQGVTGVTSFQTLDDLVHWLANRQRFPQLKEIVLIGHSAGAQLMQRYAALNDQDAFLAQAGLSIRYVISSPSSYLYFDPHRPTANGFATPDATACPSYDAYRYGIAKPPAYLEQQQLSGAQLFRRYAARNILYMVGARDVDPHHRFLDKSCGAELQGATRVERQLNFMRYEQFLSQQWHIPVNQAEFQVEGAAHGADKLYRSAATVHRIFPQ